MCLTWEATTANHVDFSSSGLLWNGPCILFLCGLVLYRAGTGWHGNAIKKTVFRRAGPNFECPLLRVVFLFRGVKHKSYSTPRGGSTAAVSGLTGEMCGLWACHKIRLENHRQLGRKKLMRSGGISVEGALNRPFPFKPGVNNPNESDS